MKEILQLLDTQLALQFPDVLPTLNPPATEKQIASFEAAVSQKLPEDIKTAYRWHNGCRCLPGEISAPLSNEAYFLIYGGRWLSLDEIVTQWHVQNEIAEGDDYFFTQEDDPDQWSKLVARPWCWPPVLWLPLSREYHDAHTYIDLLPGPKGRAGQLVHQALDGAQRVIAPGMSDYLTVFAQALESKELRYDRRYQQWLGLHEALEKAKTLK
jgi:cell wall assembly regulator SMI1